MGESKEIKVNVSELEESEEKLIRLLNNIENRRVKVNLINTKGNVADNLIAVAKQLNDIGCVLSDLVKRTEIVVKTARISFKHTDNCFAQLFNELKELK